MTKHKTAPNTTELEQQIGELTQDLQRTRADFENYRKRVDAEKSQAKAAGAQQAIRKLLPVIDTIERATANVPKKLQNDTWASGVVAMSKKLDGLMAEFKLEPIMVELGTTEFDPDLHEAVSMDDEGGDKEVISEELQRGYKLDGHVLRHAMVRVSRQP